MYRIGVIFEHRTDFALDDPFECPQIQYSFHHLLFQEKCAADYVSPHGDVMAHCLQRITDISFAYGLKNFLAFVLGNKKTFQILEKIFNRLKEIPLFPDRITEENSGFYDRRELSILDFVNECTFSHYGDNHNIVMNLFKFCIFMHFENHEEGVIRKRFLFSFHTRRYFPH